MKKIIALSVMVLCTNNAFGMKRALQNFANSLNALAGAISGRQTPPPPPEVIAQVPEELKEFESYLRSVGRLQGVEDKYLAGMVKQYWYQNEDLRKDFEHWQTQQTETTTQPAPGTQTTPEPTAPELPSDLVEFREFVKQVLVPEFNMTSYANFMSITKRSGETEEAFLRGWKGERGSEFEKWKKEQEAQGHPTPAPTQTSPAPEASEPSELAKFKEYLTTVKTKDANAYDQLLDSYKSDDDEKESETLKRMMKSGHFTTEFEVWKKPQ